MSNAGELVRLIKKAAVEAVEAEKPAAVCFGRVMGVSPLKISVDQRFALGEKQLILTSAVRDHAVDVLVGSCTEEEKAGEGAEAHRHFLRGKKKIAVLRGLREGEEVILLRVEGGQRFIVLDRVFDCAAEGEWLE
ncbi:MAG: DUF2577 domain-containing protein [Ruminiclostridium sp.]|nr:DUF2577 domain-containing protein [Ruminiclostridium sp.]